MTVLLVALLLLQGTPAPKGFATGIVRSASGAPAAGVRVYAVPAGDPNAVSTGATVFESLAQTDAAGRFRLEVPAGRYFIAAGSVNSPTYYPDTTSLASAKAISIAAGSTVEGVDFSRYTAASASPSLFGFANLAQPVLPPGSTGILSGVVRSSDGTAASGMTVIAIPVSVVTNPVPTFRLVYVPGGATNNRVVFFQQQGSNTPPVSSSGEIAVTDNDGRYRFESIAPDSYYIAAGFSDAPAFYPGTVDRQKATSIVTTSATSLTSLDIEIPRPPQAFSIHGRVSANDGRPAGGATLSIQSMDSNQIALAGGLFILPSRNNLFPVTVGGDGRFEIPDIVPGKYSLQARISGLTALVKTVDVVDQDVNIDFNFAINVLSGRIVWEDGSPFSDPALAEVAISTIANPNFVATTVIPVSSDGLFSSVVEADDFRFYIRGLPAGYEVRAMSSASTDLTKDPLHISGDVPVDVEIRVAKRAGSGTRIRGRVVDAVSRVAPSAERLELCCFTSGPFERISTAVQSDGMFDFSGVPQGHYTLDLQTRVKGRTVPGIVNRTIEVGDQEKSDLMLVTATQVAPVTATVTIASGASAPAVSSLTISLTLTPGSSPLNASLSVDEVSIPMNKLRDGSYWIPFPVGSRYTINIANIPEGYRLKSVSGPGALSAVLNLDAVGRTRYSGFAPGEVSIVLEQIP